MRARQLQFEIVDWLSAPDLEPAERATLAALRILVGPEAIPLTEVEDTFAQTVRQHIHVSVHALAQWLLVNWWRLRWEAGRLDAPPDWVDRHCLAALGGDYAWPAVVFASDGEFISARLQPEARSDVAAVRYLRSISVNILAADFEAGIEELFDKVESRLRLRLPGDHDFAELRNELRAERANPDIAALCRLQARAGIDPGAASDAWLADAQALVEIAGGRAGEEVLAAVPMLPGGLRDARSALAAMQSSSNIVDLQWAETANPISRTGEVPWKRGRHLAQEVRTLLGIAHGPISTRKLGELFGVNLPLPSIAWSGSRALQGGFRNGGAGGRTSVLVTSRRLESQRSYLARLMGAALVERAHEHVLPVSDAGTALQKLERSFAQELLCPWAELDAFTSDRGVDDEAIADAAEHFGVSQLLVATTLVNNGKLGRERLPAAA